MSSRIHDCSVATSTTCQITDFVQKLLLLCTDTQNGQYYETSLEKRLTTHAQKLAMTHQGIDVLSLGLFIIAHFHWHIVVTTGALNP
jgi:hypothetical protein